jgi:glutaredoxin 3
MLIPETTRVQVFTTSYCIWCRRAEQLLTAHAIAFEKIDVTGDSAARAAIADRAQGRTTVPVVFVDGQPIGGYAELERLVATGALDHLKRQARAA